jgi:hypothetical protein
MLLMVMADNLSAVEIDKGIFCKQNTLTFQASELGFSADVLTEL